MAPDIAELLWRDLEIFLLVNALLGVVLSLLMIFRPQLLPGINRVANRWVTMRRADRVLEKSVTIDQWFYRHHRLFGVLVILGAVYVLVHFSYMFDKDAALRTFAGSFVPVMLLDGLLDALVVASLLGATVALIVGLLLWLRPALLHRVERWANLWVSSRRATKVLSVPHGGVDHYVELHARGTGWLLLTASAISLTTITSLLV